MTAISKFSDAKDDGTDLRFVAADDKTPLKFHIESYDSLLGVALVWVDLVPTQGGPTEFWMYFANKNATAGADPAGTYDPEMALVYHFADRNAPPRDETANKNTGTTAAVSTDTALIGRGAHFTGTNIITLPDSPSLAVQQGAAMTWSAWVKPAANASGALYVRRDGANAMVIGLDAGKPYVALTANGTESRSAATAPITANWHHIAVTAAAQVTTLYVDGQAAATLAAGLPRSRALPRWAVTARRAVPPNAALANYSGDMDELEISHIARSAPFIAAAVANQGPESQLLTMAESEENGGASGGTFGVILRSVEPDGWAVIAILAVMLAISVSVMISKGVYIGGAARGNARFLALYEQSRHRHAPADQCRRGAGRVLAEIGAVQDLRSGNLRNCRGAPRKGAAPSSCRPRR